MAKAEACEDCASASVALSGASTPTMASGLALIVASARRAALSGGATAPPGPVAARVRSSVAMIASAPGTAVGVPVGSVSISSWRRP